MSKYEIAHQATVYISKPELRFNNTPEKLEALIQTKADQLKVALREKLLKGVAPPPR